MLLLGISIGFVILLTMGMPVNFALGLLGIMALYFFSGADSLQGAALVAWSTTNSFILTAIPLFILMGDLIFRVGFGKDLFDTASAWFGRFRGGLGIATIFACGIFSAVSGSSAAACAAMGLLAIPEMERFKYNKRLIYGTVAAGGSLDILIPPSVILIVYGAFAEQSIAQLYLAGFIPGFFLSFFFMVVIYVWTRLHPEAAPTVQINLTFREKLRISKNSLIFILLVAACLGTIYVGIATPTEAAGLGAAFTVLAALIMKRLTWRMLKESLLGTVSVTCMVLFLILGGLILSNFLMTQNVPNRIMEFVFSQGLTGWKLIIFLYVIYAVLGCLIDGLTLIIITLPIVIPMMKKMGVDLIWFGIVMVMLVELAQLHPPVGMNLFIVRNISKGKIEDVIIGSAPFIIAIIVAMAMITIWPSVVLYLPKMIKY